MKKFLLPLFLVAAVASACSPKQKDPATENASKVAVNAQGNLDAAQKFLAENKTKPGVITTKSGLQYQYINKGKADAPMAKYESVVSVNYEGSLLDGKVFDSSYKRGEAAVFPVSKLIPGWTEMLQLMHVGDEVTLWVSPQLGYGAENLPTGCGVDIPCDIPANSLLKFKMKLEKIEGKLSATGDIIPAKAEK